MGAAPQVTAAGTINVASFVCLNSTTNDQVVQATGVANPIFGIAANYPDNFPLQGGGPGGSGQAAAYAALAGEAVAVQVEGRAYLQAGSGGWAAGQLLTSDTSGYGIVASSTNNYGAIGLSTITVGEWGEVFIRFGKA